MSRPRRRSQSRDCGRDPDEDVRQRRFQPDGHRFGDEPARSRPREPAGFPFPGPRWSFPGPAGRFDDWRWQPPPPPVPPSPPRRVWERPPSPPRRPRSRSPRRRDGSWERWGERTPPEEWCHGEDVDRGPRSAPEFRGDVRRSPPLLLPRTSNRGERRRSKSPGRSTARPWTQLDSAAPPPLSFQDLRAPQSPPQRPPINATAAPGPVVPDDWQRGAEAFASPPRRLSLASAGPGRLFGTAIQQTLESPPRPHLVRSRSGPLDLSPDSRALQRPARSLRARDLRIDTAPVIYVDTPSDEVRSPVFETARSSPLASPRSPDLRELSPEPPRDPSTVPLPSSSAPPRRPRYSPSTPRPLLAVFEETDDGFLEIAPCPPPRPRLPRPRSPSPPPSPPRVASHPAPPPKRNWLLDAVADLGPLTLPSPSPAAPRSPSRPPPAGDSDAERIEAELEGLRAAIFDADPKERGELVRKKVLLEDELTRAKNREWGLAG
ncbi:hypothetical protein DFJ74DRAFT_645245 [Hyaloraphidium curvatum]|nr:hypothetical protein DFJ74DRAFT_645245 [Hyaloraphidium curvatum]